jgi:hypothetical protein
MCTLLADVQIESGTEAFTNDDPFPITCESGRVIIAATAWVGSTSTAKPIGVSLADGDPSDTCTVYPTSNMVSGLTATIHYSLTTARIVTL